jgi:hypothetical protein
MTLILILDIPCGWMGELVGGFPNGKEENFGRLGRLINELLAQGWWEAVSSFAACYLGSRSYSEKEV